MPDDIQKVPSQVFRWFEKMKSNYEQSIQSVLLRFEQYSQSQQLRIDQANQSHIDNLKQAHQQHLEQQSAQIKQMSQDATYYKEQILKQQQTIDHLNGRYDAVMSCLLVEKRKDIDIKDIFSNDFVKDKPNDSLEVIKNTVENNSNIEDNANIQEYNSAITNTSVVDEDELFDQAIIKREAGDNEEAFQLFKQAATLGHAKSMGAMGRSFFLGEGTIEDHAMGLAWLIHAANQALPQAVTRVEHFREADHELYQDAVHLAERLELL